MRHHWKFEAASDSQVTLWSNGLVKSVDELYSPSIFGSTEISPHLLYPTIRGIEDALDRPKERYRRIGHLRLATFVEHPLNAECSFMLFPIAPIAYRTLKDGSPTPLGRKYELLVEVNQSVAKRYPEPTMLEPLVVGPTPEYRAVQEAVADVFGLRPGAAPGVVEEDSIFSLLLQAVATLNSDIFVIARACLLTLQLDVDL